MTKTNKEITAKADFFFQFLQELSIAILIICRIGVYSFVLKELLASIFPVISSIIKLSSKHAGG